MRPNEIKRALEQALKEGQSQVMRTIGEIASDEVKKTTRLGYGVDSGQRQKLKPLSDRYKEYREENSDLLSPVTTKSRSNLTFTGQMLESMQVLRSGKDFVIIGPKGSRRDTSLTNSQIAGYVEKQGRPFNDLSDNQKKLLERQLLHRVASALNKKDFS